MGALWLVTIPSRVSHRLPTRLFHTAMQRGTNPVRGVLPERDIWRCFFLLRRALMHTFTRLALQWILDKGFKLFSFQLEDPKGPLLLFFVTTSPSRDWVICAPAAFLGCGSRFSGSLSGIEP